MHLRGHIQPQQTIGVGDFKTGVIENSVVNLFPASVAHP